MRQIRDISIPCSQNGLGCSLHRTADALQVFFGAELAVSCLKRRKKPALILGSLAAAAVLGLVLNAAFPGENDLDFDAAWTVPEAQPAEEVYTPATIPAGRSSRSVPMAAGASDRALRRLPSSLRMRT